MSLKLAPVSLIALAIFMSPSAKSDELTDLRTQLSQMAQRIEELEKKSKDHASKAHHHAHGKHHSHDIAINEAAFEMKLNERIKKIELENHEMKLASQNTVKSGSVPGSFLIPGTDTSLKIYGYVKVDGIYSSRAPGGDGSAESANSSFMSAPLKGTKIYNQGSELAAKAQESRLGFDTHTVYSKGTIKTRVEGDFYGKGSTLRLRKAYIDYVVGNHGILFGQESTSFADGNAADSSETLDFSGILGTAGGRVPMIRYTYVCSPAMKFIAALEEPDTNYKDTTANLTDDNSINNFDASNGNTVERVPDLILHARFGDDKAHLSLRGLVTQQAYDDGDYSKRKVGYGVGQSGHYTFSNKDEAAYDVTYGNALDGWVSGGAGAILDSTNPQNKDFYLQNVLGVAVSYKHMWNDTLRSTVGLGMLEVYNKGPMKNLQTNKSVRDLHINLIESPVKNFDVGIEYAVGERTVEKAIQTVGSPVISNKGMTHRVQISAKYAF